MKIITTIARLLLALEFLVFGLNGFFHFLNMPPPAGTAGQFLGALFVSHFLTVVFVIQVVSGFLFLINRAIPIALTLIGPVIVNILLFHIFMDPSGIVPGAIAAVLWLIVLIGERSAFSGIFK